MFRVCRTQGSIPWCKTTDGGRRPDFLGAIQFLWQSCRVEKVKCRILHSPAAASEVSSVPPTGAASTTTVPRIELLPAPRGRKYDPPRPVPSDFARRFLDTEALKELEKDLHLDSITSFVPVGPRGAEDVKSAPETEGGWNRQETEPRPLAHGPRTIAWGKNKEDKRFINRVLQDKSYLSYDWRVPLKLLKKHYRADKDGDRTEKDLIRETARGAIRSGDVLAETVEEPNHWSQGTFYRYVYDLAHFQPPPSPVSRALHLRRQRRGPHTIPEIGDTLIHLFHRTELSHCLEIEACNVALWFFTKHFMLSNARALFLRMEHQEMTVPTRTFNIFMRAAAHEKDLHTFSWLLITMIKRGFNPNAETWVIFVQCLERIAVKRLIIREMVNLNILYQPNIRKAVITTTVKEDVIKFLSGKGEPRDFLYLMRLKHGPDWLSTRTGCIILNEVSKRVSLDAGLQLLEPLKRYGFQPNDITLGIPLDQALQLGSLRLTAQVLETFETHTDLSPGRYAHERLFLFAWRRGYLNVIRVIWISACVQGFVTYPMQAKILYSLRLNALQYHSASYYPRRPTRRPNKSAHVFRSLVGKFLIGIHPFRDHSLRTGQEAIATCIRMALKARLKHPLSQHLKEAWAVDYEWGIRTGQDLEAKLQHRYPVLLVADRPDTERGY